LVADGMGSVPVSIEQQANWRLSHRLPGSIIFFRRGWYEAKIVLFVFLRGEERVKYVFCYDNGKWTQAGNIKYR
jgi:hypothetical protein